MVRDGKRCGWPHSSGVRVANLEVPTQYGAGVRNAKAWRGSWIASVGVPPRTQAQHTGGEPSW